MRKVVLKTTKRKTTVPRAEIRKAISGIFSSYLASNTNTLNSPQKSAKKVSKISKQFPSKQ